MKFKKGMKVKVKSFISDALLKGKIGKITEILPMNFYPYGVSFEPPLKKNRYSIIYGITFGWFEEHDLEAEGG